MLTVRSTKEASRLALCLPATYTERSALYRSAPVGAEGDRTATSWLPRLETNLWLRHSGLVPVESIGAKLINPEDGK